jgi:hypothetical protein
MRELSDLDLELVSGGTAPLVLPVVTVTGVRISRPWLATGQSPAEFYNQHGDLYQAQYEEYIQQPGVDVNTLDDGAWVAFNLATANSMATLYGSSEIRTFTTGNYNYYLETNGQPGYSGSDIDIRPGTTMYFSPEADGDNNGVPDILLLYPQS